MGSLETSFWIKTPVGQNPIKITGRINIYQSSLTPLKQQRDLGKLNILLILGLRLLLPRFRIKSGSTD
ncbi:hypothetical protein M0804_014134 [Polistes exclamans]|nr:hypothetical protein M0804_014134 [Polistes exclamans]